MTQRRERFSFKDIGNKAASAGKTAGGAVATAGKTAGGAVATAGKGVGRVFGGVFGGLLKLLRNIKLIVSLVCCCFFLVYFGPVLFALGRGALTAARATRAAAAGVAAGMAAAAPVSMPVAAAPAIGYVAANLGGGGAAGAVARPYSYGA